MGDAFTGCSSPEAGGGWIVRHVQSVAELDAAGVIAPADDRYRCFHQKELRTARWLTANGLDGLTWVRELDAADGIPTPDGVFGHRPDSMRTIEMKALDEPTENAVKQAVRRARRQSRLIVIDARRVAATEAVVVTGLRRAIRDYGLDVDQVIVVVADGAATGWRS